MTTQIRNSAEVRAEITELESRRAALLPEVEAASKAASTAKTGLVYGRNKSGELVKAKIAAEALESALDELDEVLNARRAELLECERHEQREAARVELAQLSEQRQFTQSEQQSRFKNALLVFVEMLAQTPAASGRLVAIESQMRNLCEQHDLDASAYLKREAPTQTTAEQLAPELLAHIPDRAEAVLVGDIFVGALNASLNNSVARGRLQHAHRARLQREDEEFAGDNN
jgi:hypothetical protein